MTTLYFGMVMASCCRCKVEGGPLVRINYGSAEKPDLGSETYCIDCGQKRRDALNALVASGIQKRKCPSTYTHSNLGKLACEKDEGHLNRRGDVEHLGCGVKWMSI